MSWDQRRRQMHRSDTVLVVAIIVLLALLSALFLWLFSGWRFLVCLTLSVIVWIVVGRYAYVIETKRRKRRLTVYQETQVLVHDDAKYFRDRIKKRSRINRYFTENTRYVPYRGLIERRLLSLIAENEPGCPQEDEVIVMLRFHWAMEIRKPQPYALLAMAAIVLWVAIYRLLYGQGDWHFPWWLVLLMEVIPLGLLWFESIDWRYRYLMATNRRCILVSMAPLLIEPFVRSSYAPLDWDRIGRVRRDLVPSGNWWGYGQLIIETSMQFDEDFNNGLNYVPHIEEVQDKLERARMKAISHRDNGR